MTQTSMFGGESFDEARDGQRLAQQLSIVRSVMADHRPHTLDELAKAAACSTASASARVRDLRKPKHGSQTVTRNYIGNGVWSYTLEWRVTA